MIGQTISHYKITEKLGEGGMGVVYKAEDTNLKRPVALKFLAAHLLGDEEVKARFQREAEAAAALNHPNICTVHEIAEANGRTFIAMAFIEGEPVEKKIEAGPLKLKDALDIAIQTAQGLQAAHEKKIVHRDIKPANLMVTGSGTKQHVTIMDFGLAQLADRSKLTKSGTTLGTPIYMSPEQAQGEESDHHTDIWSLGVVLYEMVVGRPPFRGDYEQAVVYSILNEEPEPLTALRTGVPMEMERIVGKCMEKETAERYQHTDDLLLDLQTLRKKLESGKSTILGTAPAGSVGARHAVPTATEKTTGTRAQHAVPLHSPAEASEHPLVKYRVIEDVEEADDSIKYLAEDTQLHRSVAIRVVPESAEKKLKKRRSIQLIGWGLGTAALLAAAFVFGSRSSTVLREARVERFTVVPPERLGLGFRDGGVSISPNGEHIAFVAGSSVWIQDLDNFEPRKIEGTEGARSPMWSPDSRQVAFATDNELRKVAVEGGPAALVCALPGSAHLFTGSWDAESDSIVFAAGAPGRPYEVPARGGTAVPVTLAIAEDERKYILWPALLPSGSGERRLLYWNGGARGGEILTETLPAREREVLVAASVWLPLYSVSGHLLYQTGVFRQSRVLWALPLPHGVATSAEAFPIAQNTMFPSVSSEGTLAYVESPAGLGFQPIWRSRDGEKIGESVLRWTTSTIPPFRPTRPRSLWLVSKTAMGVSGSTTSSARFRRV